MKALGLLALAGLLVGPLVAQYTYDYPNLLNPGVPSQWTLNSAIYLNGSGLGGVGSGIFVPTLPTPSNGYEINTTLGIPSYGAEYTLFLRATSNAQGYINGTGGVGTSYGISIEGSQPSGQNSTFCYVQLYQYINGTSTQLYYELLPCNSGMTVRAVITQSNYILLYFNNVLYINQPVSAISSGQPGLGVADSSWINQAAIGHQDTVPPIAINASSISSYVEPTQVDLKWGATTDDPVGIGLLEYSIYRNGALLGSVPPTTTTFSDYSVRPNTTYTYTIYAIDQHLNQVGTSYNVTTPAMSTFVPKIGVRPLGSYWGAAGEQIDMQSGNLNYTTPILKAMGRGGWGVNFQLSYNSQNWREDSGGVWQLGQDTGYGYGWRLQAGSMTPIYSGTWTLDHYLFIDSTGGAHPFTVNNNNLWTSTDGLYLSYDANAQVLHFPDGSFWTFGSTSTALEQDAGTMYPTVMEDSNGNQVMIKYYPGAGSTMNNTSSRINTIEDVRGNGYPDYTFTYNSDPIPHLTGITNTIQTAENYRFGYTENYTLNDPFAGTNFGTVALLEYSQATSNPAQPLTTFFTYDTASPTTTCTSTGTGATGPAQLTQITTPYCGHLRWAYHPKTLSGTTRMEIQYRYLSMFSGAAETNVQLIRANDSSDTVHLSATLNDSTANAQKIWNFQTDTTKFNLGLVTQYSENTLSPQTTLSRQNYAWSQTTNSLNPYISSTTTHLNLGQAYEADKQTTQTLDQYGNLTQMQVYNFGAGVVGTLARTYTNTYLSGANYTAANIFNRLLTSTVTDGTNTTTLAQNYYDNQFNLSYCPYGFNLVNVTGQHEHDDANYGTGFLYRGDLGISVTPTTTICSSTYDIDGNVLATLVNGVQTNVTPSSTNNYAAPGQITTNSLNSTMNWNGFLGLSSASGPNGDTGSINYDANARPGQTTSPYGAVTSYTYNDTASPPNKIATTDGHWVKTVMDGFGRTIQTITGYGSTTVSTVDTKYAPCGCSPLGKLSQQSQPYAPGGSDAWTTYSYDASGRTLTAVLPEGSTTTYLYQGNDVYVWNPAGNWKVFAMDAFGNLVVVGEPDPTLGNVWSYYGYDILNHLTGVILVRGSNTQTRAFNYNSGTTVTGFLQSATNPENGTVTYTYNPGTNTLASKTDAKGQKLLYAYDSYNRLSTVTLSPSTLLRTYIYDTNTLDSTGFSQYTSGRLAAVKYPAQSGVQMNDMYSYTPAGLPAAKRVQVNQTATVNLDSTYAYNTEGKITGMTYPMGGPSYNYSYNSMYQLSGMTDSSNNTIVSGVSYNAANQLLGMKFNSETETRGYNSLNQLITLSASVPGIALENITYAYPAGTNNGKIASMSDTVSGESVVYTYDSLNRLLTAGGNGWGQSYAYDAFGNLLQKNITAGSPPSLMQAVNPANNQIVGQSYDANGNTSGVANAGYNYSLYYDAENRLSTVYFSPQGLYLEYYGYDAQNRRIWSWPGTLNGGTTTNYTVNVYSPAGQKLGAYLFMIYGSSMNVTLSSSDQYFGSRRLATLDQLGSAGNGGVYKGTYFPWGEAKGTPNPQDTWNFATYWQDSVTGLDYANNRYYSNAYGRFMTPDPGLGSSPANPQSWNRYTYTLGDPVNYNDPGGTTTCDASGGNCYDSVTVYSDGSSSWSDIPPGGLMPSGGASLHLTMPSQYSIHQAQQLASLAALNMLVLPMPCANGQVVMSTGNCDKPLSPTAQQTLQMVGQALDTQLRQAVTLGLSVYAGAAIGGLIEAIAVDTTGTATASFFDNTTLSQKVLDQMANDLATSGGGFHSFPSSVAGFENAGTITTDGTYTQLNISGSYLSPNGNWYNGTFEFGKDSTGTITHWFFNPGP